MHGVQPYSIINSVLEGHVCLHVQVFVESQLGHKDCDVLTAQEAHAPRVLGPWLWLPACPPAITLRAQLPHGTSTRPVSGFCSLCFIRPSLLHPLPSHPPPQAPLAVGSLRFLAASGCGGGGGVVALARYGSAMQPVALTAAQLAAEAAKAAARSGWGGPGDRGGGGTAVGGAGGRGIGGVVGAALAARVGAHGVPLPG